MWKRETDESENDVRVQCLHESEIRAMLSEMIQHGEHIPRSFADGTYEQAWIDYQRARAQWKNEEQTAALETREGPMPQEPEPKKDPIGNPPSYCVGMTWNSRLNPSSTPNPIAVSTKPEVMEEYLSRIQGFRAQHCILQIGEAQYEAFDESGYSLIQYQGIWLTQRDFARFQECEAADTEWWYGVQKAFVELEERLSSYPKEDLPYGKECLLMLQAVIDKIPMWAVRKSEKDAIIAFLRREGK